MTQVFKSIAILLALATATTPVMAQEQRAAAKLGLAAHCTGLVKPARDKELSILPTLRGERALKVITRHTRATADAGDMKAVLACLTGAVSAAK